ncbi:hypothetical protein M422DRAFT_68133 [Sphaerobolus stellatus SS14]|uniref:Uncharacterized protein n=1 Tax=Sphaerobolus stellatus (strain SS14) TaxID=990650 RepID=A0A0C9VTV3_SPHS4|nr:hypothetical protein M422DRAFT_68133 [Sphaerobolus stellatus SS14]
MSISKASTVSFFMPMATLDVRQMEPVRGQLEDAKNTPIDRPGWRWLQCTENINEVRVLIPPSVANDYVELLKAEYWELNTYFRKADGSPDIAWERVVKLRVIKSTIINKAYKYAVPSMSSLLKDRLQSTFIQREAIAEGFKSSTLRIWARNPQDIHEPRLLKKKSKTVSFDATTTILQDYITTEVCGSLKD